MHGALGLDVDKVIIVGCKTPRLLLDVTRDFNSTRHIFNCKLLFGDSPVQNRLVMLKLNQTGYRGTTNSAGLAQIVLWLSPQQNNNQTNFNVVASFEGDTSSVAKASMMLPNGTSYPVCTTFYNGYKPSGNSTTITVKPQTTTGATTLMNTEQMQEDARNKRQQ